MKKSEVNLIRGQIVKRLMGALCVVKAKSLFKALSKFGSIAKRPQTKILILERPPQRLDENIVLVAATSIHSNVDPIIFKYVCKGIAGDSNTLVIIEDLRPAKAADRIVKRLNRK